ncbi:MAG: Dihydrolipoyllysine-residue acetyltransferase component of pyruvate dehydrogenase complex [Cellulomonadaceae bacterium TMED98]|nr:MAG: Dihydrolipoyllysine-residue acetyltransferase component of pyruvate dehydrogenase complex [Cellulomonadaceae bacterium TMED98]
MATVIRMPEVLAGAAEAVISQWMIQEGQEVAVGDTLAEIETEKANVDYQAEEQGRLARVLIKPGETVEVGAPIAVFAAAGDTDDDIEAALAAAGGADAPAAAATEPAPTAEATPAPATETHAPSSPTPPPAPAEQSPVVQNGGRIYASPLVRKRARESGIDLSQVTGTGPGGRIVKKDLESFTPAAPAAPAAPASTPATPAPAPAYSQAATGEAGYTDRPHTGMRRAIARRLTESKTTVPHFYVTADCRVEKLLEARTQMNEATGVKVSVNDWVMKAVAKALMEVPDANVIWTDEALRFFNRADIAVAVAVEGGLLTPVLRGVESMSLTQINHEVTRLATKAREGAISQAEIEGGSFSVSNLGMYGTDAFQAILNPPQSGILAVGAARDAVVVENGELVAGKVMTVNLSADHRAVDGALAAEWMKAFRHYIENPLALLA